MATLYVRNFPEELYQRLKAAAAQTRRSLAAEVVVIVDEALEGRVARDRSVEALRRIEERRRRNPQPAGAVDTLTMLREDRAR